MRVTATVVVGVSLPVLVKDPKKTDTVLVTEVEENGCERVERGDGVEVEE